MADGKPSGLTIVGGRPEDEGRGASAISPGLRALLDRIAKKPQLAREWGCHLSWLPLSLYVLQRGARLGS